MVLIKHNYLKSDIFFNPIFIAGFSGSRFLGSGSRVQGPGPGYRSSPTKEAVLRGRLTAEMLNNFFTV